MDIGKLVVNNFQLKDLCGRYIGNYTFELKKKKLRVIVEDVAKFLNLLSSGPKIKLVKDFHADHRTPF